MKSLLWALGFAVAANGAPMQKVVTALENMQKKSEEEMQREKLDYAKFEEFCSHTLADKKLAIQETTALLDGVTAEIEKLQSGVEKLSNEISGHEASIAKAEGAKSNASKLRKDEQEDFEAKQTDLGESLAAIEKALKQLKNEAYDRPQKPSFVQDEDALSQALALVERFKSTPTPPKPDAYEFQSGKVIDILEDLRDQFVKQKAEVEASETRRKHSHELLLASLDSEVKVNEKSKGEKSGFKSSALSRKAEAEAKKADVTADLEADEKFRSDLETECSVKTRDFKERQGVRQAELDAISQALKILRPSLLSTSLTLASRTSLAQLRAERRRVGPVAEAMQFLQDRARELHSDSLQLLLRRLEEVPDVAVENISKLLKERWQKLLRDDLEGNEKVWCEKQLAENAEAQETKSDGVEKLKAEIQRLQASLLGLGEENAQLSSDITKLDESVSEATSIRKEEKASFSKSHKEATENKDALLAAIEVLSEFYQKHGSSLVQTLEAEVKPEFKAGSYTSGQGKILEMLQEAAADYTQEAATLEAAETAAAAEFQQFIADSESDKKKKTMTKQHNIATVASQKKSLEESRKDLLSTEKQLSAALEYYQELKPKCVDSTTNYAEARKKRDEEVESLKNAYEILMKTT